MISDETASPGLIAGVGRLFSGMTLANFPELVKLPKHKRMKLAEELWFSGVNDSLPVSPVHKRTLDKRWAAYQAGKIMRITLPDLERHLVRS